jgi:uncharacterized damage-inducible protein DinB
MLGVAPAALRAPPQEITMLGKTILHKALEHRRWATARIFDAAARLSDEQYRADAGHGHGSLHALLFHILRVDRIWRGAVEAPDQPRVVLMPEAFPDLAALRAAWEAEDAALAALLDGLSEDDLAATIHVSHPRYGLQATIRAFPLLQMLMHGLQHRTEAAAILTGYGQSPGDLDFVFTDGVFTPVP